MVFPWLVIGASAAIESARRTNQPPKEQTVRKLKDVEKHLRERQRQLANNLQEAVAGLATERESHETDKQKLTDMSAHIQEIENRMVQLQEMTDGLITENEQLKVEKGLLQEEARYAQKENQELRQETQLLRLRNDELEDKIDKLARDSELEVARITELLDQLKGEVAEAMSSFTRGGEAIEFQERMEKLGIKLDCKLEDLERISMSEPAKEALEDAVTTQFNNQMGLVMEDRSRLEHLMGIAQGLRLKGKSELPRVASTDWQPFEKPVRMPLQSDSIATNGVVGLGGGILGSLNFSKDSVSQLSALTESGSSIPSGADVPPMLVQQDDVEQKMQSMQLNAVPEEPTVSGPEAVVSESVTKAKRGPLFKFRFKGLQEQNKSKAVGMPSAKGIQDEDGALCSSDVVLK